MARLNFFKKAVITASAVFVLFSCRDKEPQKLWCDCADELFYYYYDGHVYEKIFLDDVFLNDWLVVGIESQVKDEEIVNFINQTGLFKPVKTSDVIFGRPSQDDEIDDYPDDEYMHLIFVNTLKPKTCSQLKEIIQTLEKSSFVAYANLTFETNWHGELINMDLMSFTNEVIVKLKKLDDLPVLNSITSETNTQIKKQMRPEAPIFIISTNKNSKGNALQMANYFHETGNFEWAEPNKLYAKVNR